MQLTLRKGKTGMGAFRLKKMLNKREEEKWVVP
jgi:hypothetical protein